MNNKLEEAAKIIKTRNGRKTQEVYGAIATIAEELANKVEKDRTDMTMPILITIAYCVSIISIVIMVSI